MDRLWEIPDSKLIEPIGNGTITILFRGRTFRGRGKEDYDDQVSAIHSISKFVINPIKKNFSECNVKIIICTYENKYNLDLVNILKNYGYEVELLHMDNNITGQIYSYRQALTTINDDNEFIFILRPDLIFKKEIDFSRVDKNKILFQWNLFTFRGNANSPIRVPDQYQFVGGNVFEKYKDLIMNDKIDEFSGGTLHNLFNFLINNSWPLEEISYLNYIEDPNPQDVDCAIKGDPASRLGNPMFDYTIRNKSQRRITN